MSEIYHELKQTEKHCREMVSQVESAVDTGFDAIEAFAENQNVQPHVIATVAACGAIALGCATAITRGLFVVAGEIRGLSLCVQNLRRVTALAVVQASVVHEDVDLGVRDELYDAAQPLPR